MLPFVKFVYVTKTKELHKITVTSNEDHTKYIQFIEKIMRSHYEEQLKGKSYYSYTPRNIYWANQCEIPYKDIPDEVKAVFALCD